jgi:hypothetical protein
MSMKSSLILGICIVLASATAAQADLLNVWNGTQTYPGVLRYTRVPIDSTTDLINIYCNNLLAMSGPPASPLKVLEGTFAVLNPPWLSGSPRMKLTQQCSVWPDSSWIQLADTTGRTIGNIVPNSSYRGSFVNLPCNDSPAAYWGESLTGETYTYNWVDDYGDPQALTGAYATSLYGSWNSGTGRKDGDLLAALYVDKGAGLMFTGCWFQNQSSNGGWGFNNSVYSGGSFGILPIPEPSTLFLVTGGLAGLLGYAWRKRR